jgi:hypothetical protein
MMKKMMRLRVGSRLLKYSLILLCIVSKVIKVDPQFTTPQSNNCIIQRRRDRLVMTRVTLISLPSS